MIEETVYLSHNNTIDIQLLLDREEQDLTSVTRMVLKGSDCEAVVDSVITPTAFDWSAGEGKLELSLGGVSIAAGHYVFLLIIYSGDNPDGVIWDKIGITFKSICDGE